MTGQTQRIAICHLLLRGNRWMPVSVNKNLDQMTVVHQVAQSSPHTSVRLLKEIQ
jgi:hypothetical protein